MSETKINASQTSITAEDIGAAPVVTTMSAVSLTNIGKIVQFVGTTDSTYTNGYFYKASGTPVTTTYGGSLQVLSPSGASITIDWAELVDAAYNTIRWMSYDQIVSALQQNIGKSNMYYVDTGELYLDGFVSIDTTTYTNVCTVTGYGAETQVEFMITAFSSPYTEIQNGHWERVNVQPQGDSLPSQSGNSGKFLITDGTDTSWGTTVNPIVIGNESSTNYTPVDFVTMNLKYNGNTVTNKIQAQYNSGIRLVTQQLIVGNGSVTGIDPSGSGNIGSTYNKWTAVYTTKLNNGADIAVPTVAGSMAVQVSTMPTASSTLEGQIYQYIGATDSTYTHGYIYECVSDGGNPATYSWAAVSVQAGGGGSSYTAGTGIDITSGVISVTTPTITNISSWPNTINIGGTEEFNGGSCVIIGLSASGSGSTNYSGVAIGYAAQCGGTGGTAIGESANAYAGTAIGRNASVPYGSTGAIQIGDGTNSDANTFKVANTNGNFEIMSADGSIPTDRFTTTPSSAGSYTPTITVDGQGAVTRSWAAAASAPVVPSTMPTLLAASWNSNTQTVNVTGVTASNIVFVSPAPASASDYAAAGIVCTAQASGTLTFTCATVPSNDITVNVVILG